MLWDLRDNALDVAREMRVAHGAGAHAWHVRCGRDPGRPDDGLVLTGVVPDHGREVLLHLRVLGRLDLALQGTNGSPTRPADKLWVCRAAEVLRGLLPTVEPAHATDDKPGLRDLVDMTGLRMAAGNQLLAVGRGAERWRVHQRRRTGRSCHRARHDCLANALTGEGKDVGRSFF